MGNRLNIVGEKRGMLTVTKMLGTSHHDGQNFAFVECLCECGNTKVINQASFRANDVKSCGCSSIKMRAEAHQTHGLTKHPLFKLWSGIKQRCYYKNFVGFKDYGGRGIKVCQEWLSDFTSFYDWCNKNGWAKGLQLDRKNNDGNYEPNNCRFVTRLTNCRNRRNTKVVLYKGETITVLELSELTGIPYHRLLHRAKMGLSENDLVQPGTLAKNILIQVK